jgi:hypothetical protein
MVIQGREKREGRRGRGEEGGRKALYAKCSPRNASVRCHARFAAAASKTSGRVVLKNA